MGDLARRGVIAPTAAPMVMATPSGPAMAVEEAVRVKPKRRRTRAAKKNDNKMSKALAQANQELRKQNGDLRKGVSQSDIMTRAHRIRKTL